MALRSHLAPAEATMYEENVPNRVEDRSTRAGYAPWIALGAIAAGSVGAIVGMAKCRHAGARTAAFSSETEPETFTAPHGDKLRGAIV